MEKNKISLLFVDETGILENYEDVKDLRVNHRIVAFPIGF